MHNPLELESLNLRVSSGPCQTLPFRHASHVRVYIGLQQVGLDSQRFEFVLDYICYFADNVYIKSIHGINNV